MKLKLTILALSLTATFALADPLPSETEILRLLHPTFEELQAEFVWQRITTFRCLPDDLIERALDKHFERMQFFAFECNDNGDVR